MFLTTPHQHYYPLVDELGEFIDNINADLQESKAEQHTTRFAIVKDAQLTITVADDKMSARLEILAPYGGSVPSIDEAIAFCHEKLVTRGISHKRIAVLLERANNLQTGKSISEIIARGLPVKEGKASECMHLVKNTLERILQPKINDKDIPVGARILFVARDFWRYRIGKVSTKKFDAIEAKAELNRHRGTKYDPDILDILAKLDVLHETLPDDGSKVLAEVKVGMELSKDIYNEKYVLMLPEGHIFTEATIAKLKQYERNHKEQLRIFVTA